MRLRENVVPLGMLVFGKARELILGPKTWCPRLGQFFISICPICTGLQHLNLSVREINLKLCKDMVSRFLLSLAFDVCEAEEDAEGLRALRRVMVCYFLANKPERLDSKYASFTIIDLAVELSESQRTRKRMDHYVTINPSGTAGGGLFRDKFMEHCVRAVKGCIRTTHGGIDDIKLEKEVGGLSVITEIIQHNRSSTLRGRVGKARSNDMVGDEVREQLEENAAKYDPFSRSRKTKYTFHDKSKGGLYKGLTEKILDKFIASKKREFKLKYR